jgi:dihydroorotate dehydrogenase
MEMARQDLMLNSIWMNASGSMGFLPPAAGWNWPEPMGAFITNPVSFSSRLPAEERCLLPYPGGFLMHTGWPNPGFRQVLKRWAKRWADARIPVWVHVLAEEARQVQQMVEQMEELEGVMAVEIGLPPRAAANETLSLIEAARGELPLVISLPLDASREPWVQQLPAMGVSAVTLSAPRGILPAPGGRLASGRVYGPGLLPQTLDAVRRLKPLGLPVIAGCGIFRKNDGLAALSAGAWAVQLDAILWGGINIPSRS